MPPKAKTHPDRFREIISDVNNIRIPRVPDAGCVYKNEQGREWVRMHNGLKVYMDSYYGNFTEILRFNRGVHEPQEEYMFGEVLNAMPLGFSDLPMIELGSYWSFYSMWYKKFCPYCSVYMVEPDAGNIELGKQNFALNNLEGEFIQAKIGPGGFNVSEFVQRRGIKELGILHADIQSAELHLLKSEDWLFNNGIPRFVFISTHSQDLHLKCMAKLQGYNYRIIASADHKDETFSFDGVIVACRNEIEFESVDIFSRARGNTIDGLGRIMNLDNMPF